MEALLLSALEIGAKKDPFAGRIPPPSGYLFEGISELNNVYFPSGHVTHTSEELNRPCEPNGANRDGKGRPRGHMWQHFRGHFRSFVKSGKVCLDRAGAIALGFEVFFRPLGFLGASGGDAFSTRFPEHLPVPRVILGSLCRFQADWGSLWEAFWYHFLLFF